MTLSLSPLKKLSKGASDRIGTLGLMDSDILAEDRMAGLMDTPLAARTKQKSLAGFNERGLMNTSMANEGAMGALLDSSFKIADADANRIGNLALGATEELGRNTRQEDQQTWQSGETTLDRSHRTSERLGAESFTGGQNALDRAWRTGERLGTETFTAGQNALDRSLTTTLQDDAQEHGVLMQDDAQAHGVTLQDDSQDFTGQQNELDRSATADLQDDSQLFTSGENALDRAATADNARENRDWQERQNLGAQTFQRETRDSQNQWQASQTQATRDFELMLAERGWDRADAKEIERLGQETYGSYTNAMGGLQASYTAAILKINQSDLPPDVKASQIDALNTLFGSNATWLTNTYKAMPNWDASWSTLSLEFGDSGALTGGQAAAEQSLSADWKAGGMSKETLINRANTAGISPTRLMTVLGFSEEQADAWLESTGTDLSDFSATFNTGAAAELSQGWADGTLEPQEILEIANLGGLSAWEVRHILGFSKAQADAWMDSVGIKEEDFFGANGAA